MQSCLGPGPLSTDGIQTQCRKYSALIGEQIHPHICRHTFAKKFLEDNGNDLAALALILGHANIQTTARYAAKDQSKLWHNMRATRDSELSAMGIPDAAVAELMGNSVDVSRKHYKFITKELFDSLTGTSEGVADQVGTPVGTQPPATVENGGIEQKAIRVFPGFYVIPEEFKHDQYARQDSNLQPSVPKTDILSS